MSFTPFIFKEYVFDPTTRAATFRYAHGETHHYEEIVTFDSISDEYNPAVLDRALFLSFILLGTSYYKGFPSQEVVIERGGLDAWQAQFFNSVFQEGLSQFAFENNLTRASLAHFLPSLTTTSETVPYSGNGIVSLQSGGKDSLLTATLLEEKALPFTSWHLSQTTSHPSVLDSLDAPLRTAARRLDTPMIKQVIAEGGKNGHVPVTYMVMSLALIDTILTNDNTVLVSIGHEGEEPHEHVGSLVVNHQWSKTWFAEQQFAEYVRRYISPSIRIGSPLRHLTELRIAELFTEHVWTRFGHQFSSCNVANYRQEVPATKLTWCGNCPKCANSFLLFAPFVAPQELMRLFNGQNLLTNPSLADTFKGLLGIDGIMKPFECVGETTELQLAYHMAQERWPHAEYALPFNVPSSHFNYLKEYPSQSWAKKLIF